MAALRKQTALPSSVSPRALRAPAPRLARLTPLAYALLLPAIGMAAWGPQANAQPAAAVAGNGVVSYDIPAGNLDQALSRFGAQSGAQIAVNGELTAGLRSPGVNGEHSASAALAALLAGTGLEAIRDAGGEYSLRHSARGQGGVTQLAPVTVSGYGDSSTEGSGSYAASRVSMSKGQELREIPHSVTVITRQRIEDQNLTTLTDVLDKTTGLTLQRAGNSAGSSLGNDTNFYSRGFPVSNVQIDGGAPMETSMNGFGSISQIDMAQYDHVEFLRGVDGLFSSTGDPGGTVNLVRKRAKAETQGSFASTVGSWNNYRVEGDITGALNASATLRGRAGLAYQDRDFFYDTAKMRTRLVYGSLEFDLTPRTLLTLGASYQDGDGIPDFAGLPRYTNGKDLGLSRRTALIPGWAYTRDSTREVYAKVEHSFNDNWSVNANAMYSNMRRDHSGAFGFGGVDPITRQGNYLYSYPEVNDMDRLALDVNVKGAVDAFGRRHMFLLGADYQRGKADSSQSMGYQGEPIDVFNPVWPATDLPASPLKDSYYTTEKRALYGMARFGLTDAMHLIAGGRYSNYSYKNDSWETNGSGYRQGLRHLKESDVFTPYVGLTYDVLEDWTAYASYAETFKPQYMQRKGPQPGTPLDAVEAKNYELGLKGDVFGGRANATFAIYRIEQNGAAAEDPNYPRSWGAFNCCYINQGKVVSQGFEAELAGEVAPGWQLSAGYTYNNNSDREANQSFSTITPRHMIKLWTTYRLPERLNAWSLGGGVIAQSATFTRGTAASYNASSGQWDGEDVPFEFTQGGYAVWSARVDYRINPQWSLALNVNNLFDKHYYSGVGTSASGNFYGEPRSYYLTLRGTF